MRFDYSKLRGKIKKCYKTQNSFSVALGLGRVSLSQRLNNVSDFTQLEIIKSCSLLHIPKTQIPTYFFAPEVQKSEPSRASDTTNAS